jgi:hypothetical protein
MMLIDVMTDNKRQQKLNFMGADESFENLVQLINTSKPIKLGLLKYIGNLIGLLTRRIDKITH